jgi:hypothetical protein
VEESYLEEVLQVEAATQIRVVVVILRLVVVAGHPLEVVFIRILVGEEVEGVDHHLHCLLRQHIPLQEPFLEEEEFHHPSHQEA